MPEITAIIQHASLGAGGIHVPYDGVFADESARLAAKLDASMEGKLYRQLSDNTLWMLVSAANKTWIPLGKATAKHLGDGGDDNKPMTFTWAGQEGQPTWLWGGNDGENMYVYSPSSLTVGKATVAESTEVPNVELLTSSGTYMVKKTGPHFVLIVGGGGSGWGRGQNANNGGGGAGGACFYCVTLTKGQQLPYTIGGGGGQVTNSPKGNGGGASTFNGISAPGAGQYGTPGNWLAMAGPQGEGTAHSGGLSVIQGYGAGGNTAWDRNSGQIGYAGQSGVIIVIS